MISIQVDGAEYLALEDLLQAYRSRMPQPAGGGAAVPPSVMDIKIGRKTHGPWGASAQ